MTDIHRLKDLKSLINASEKRLAIMQQDPESNIEEIVLEKTVLKASKQIEGKLERFIRLFETQ
jgi:hypothetical protein